MSLRPKAFRTNKHSSLPEHAANFFHHHGRITLGEMSDSAIPDHGVIAVIWESLLNCIKMQVRDLRMCVKLLRMYDRAFLDIDCVDVGSRIAVETPSEKSVPTSYIQHARPIRNAIAGHGRAIENVRRRRPIAEGEIKESRPEIVKVRRDLGELPIQAMLDLKVVTEQVHQQPLAAPPSTCKPQRRILQ